MIDQTETPIFKTATASFRPVFESPFELADWAVYSFTRRPLSERIIYSSIIGTPIDSVVFLGLMGFLSLAGAVAMTASKLLGALIVWWLIRRREVALPA